MKPVSNTTKARGVVAVERVVGRDWSKEFNALPEEVRTIGAAMEAKTRIQHLTMEKERLKRRYDKSVAEINDHIKNCEQWLRRLEAPNDQALRPARSPEQTGTDGK